MTRIRLLILARIFTAIFIVLSISSIFITAFQLKDYSISIIVTLLIQLSLPFILYGLCIVFDNEIIREKEKQRKMMTNNNALKETIGDV